MVETVEINENETTSEAPVVETPTTAQAKPEWLPEKFNSPEEMAKAYGELENKLGQPNPETPEPVKEDTKSDMEIADSFTKSWYSKRLCRPIHCWSKCCKGFTRR